MSQHTPGPWQHWQPTNWSCDEEKTWSVSGPPSDFMYLKNETDARLIAAAPDLLYAIKNLLNATNDISGLDGCSERAIAWEAIQKAEPGATHP